IPGAPRPALLNSTSRRPYFSRACLKSASTCFGSETSAWNGSIGASPASLAVSSSVSLRRPAITTEKPLRARAMAEARPMPLPPPVTMPTRVTSRPLVQLLRLDQPPGEAKALQVQYGRERLQGWPRNGNRLAALDVVDDVPHALLFEQLLGFPGRVCF